MNRTKQTHPKRLMSLLLAWLLCLSCVQPAFAANETATTVQMMKTEGTVSVTNSSGKSVSQRDKMRLYNGYHVETEETSYAWLNLDSSKLSKLDAVSEMELRKSGKKLELLLNSGNLFFNVTEPLEEEETLNIRTSTMVVGIRGTCGWVRVIDRWNTEVYILEGQVECRVSDPVTGEIKSTILTGGETARFVVYPQDRQGDKCDIIRNRFTEGDIPGFVLVELVEDVDLCDQIYEDSGLDILGHLALMGGGAPSGKLPSGDAATPEAIAEAERQLKEDEAETSRKLEDIREQEDGQEHNISKDPVWKDEQDEQTKGAVNNPAPAMSPVTPPIAPTELTMMITDDEAQAALDRANAVRVLPNPESDAFEDNVLTVDSGLTVPAGKSLALRPGISVYVGIDQPLRVYGTLDVEGGDIGNEGDIIVTSSNTLHVGGDLYNGDDGELSGGEGGQVTVTATGRVVVDGVFVNYLGTLDLTRGAAVKAREFRLNPMPDGWRVSDTADAEGYHTLVPEGDPDPVYYTITFRNEGAVYAALQTDGTGRVTSWPADPTRNNMEFLGWYTAETGGTRVTAASVFTQDTTVYAQWQAADPVPALYTITFRNEGAVYAARQTDGTGRVTNWPADPTRDDMEFLGWYTAETGGTQVTAASVFTQDTTVYAQWQAAEPEPSLYTITFRNEGAVYATRQADETGRVTSWPTDPTRNNMEFLGWYTAETGGTQVTAASVFTHDTTVYAQWQETGGGEEPTPDDSGKAGENVFWSYTDATKTLRFWGEGPMWDFYDSSTSSTSTPWDDYKQDAQKLTIEEGVTSIGEGAFTSCYSLSGSLALPSSITSIGRFAFQGCGLLTGTLTIPSGVTNIGSYAFYLCSGLTGDLIIPPTVTSIGSAAFDNCSGLTGATLPSSLTAIGVRTFADCKNLTQISLPSTITSIGNSAFNGCRSLATFTIPSAVTTIGESAFSGCSGLTGITIPNGVDSIGAHAFMGCSGLTSITIPSSITSIGLQVFGNCTGLENVHIPSSVTRVGDSAFSGCSNLTDVYYTGTRAQWEQITIGTNNDPLTSATIHCIDDDTDMTWRYDPDSQTLYIEGSGPMPNYNGRDIRAPWSDPTSEKYAIDAEIVEISGVTTIGSYAFFDFADLQTVTLPDGMTSIGGAAFGGCSSLTEINIPDDVTSIGHSAFASCSSLTDIVIPDGVTSIGGSAFEACSSLTSITLPDGVTSIEILTFTECISLTNITLPANVTSIGYCAFSGCEKLASINIPEGVTSIGSAAFQGCESLTDITIPAGVSIIDDFAFNACISLTNITLPANVTSIGYCAFSGCSSLTGITIPDSVTSIDFAAFNGCHNLTEIVIPAGVTKIEGYTFDGCRGLTRVALPAGLTSIADGAFRGCSGLTDITIPDSVTSMGELAFMDCSNLTGIALPAGVTKIEIHTFAGCSSLADVYYGGTRAQWNAVTIDDGNDPLLNATIHCIDGDINKVTKTVSRASSAPASGYTDVSPDAWYAEAVAYCREHGLMNGTSAARFSPDDTLTRAMMVTVLHRMAGEPAAAAEASFRDVEAGQWYTEAVSWASGNGIVLGYGNGLFGTNDPVTHEQVALLLQRRSGDADVRVYGADEPQAPATRAEIAATLMDYVKAHPNTLTEVSAMNVMCEPSGIALLPDRSLLVTDTYNKVIWRVTGGMSEIYAGSGTVEDLYGRPVGGYNDAPLAESYFKTPWAIAPFLGGWAVSDTENGAVRLVTSEITQTVNGRTKENLEVRDLGVVFDYPTGLAADGEGNLYVSDTHRNAIRKITPDGEVTTFAKSLSEPMGLCWKDGALYAAETGANRIVKIVDGVITVVAGSGEDDLKDGPAATAAFSGPKGVAVGDDGTVYVADTANSAVRQIRDGQVTTLAVRDVTDLDAFSPISPVGLLVRGNTLYICDQFSRKLLALQLG